jgi:hypothetical protein
MRDHITPGVIETIMIDLDKTKPENTFDMTNGRLALYAKDIANILQEQNHDQT